MKWSGEKTFSLGTSNFRLITWGKPVRVSTAEEFVVFKPKWMVERYLRLIKELSPKHIFELGIYQGGSCAFFHEASGAEKLVAIEFSEQPIAALEAYANRQATQSMVPFYGINQADHETLMSIYQTEFGDQQLDLVIDDASHFLEETRASFNSLFPKLRPGGAYVIEDWPWAHDSVLEKDDDCPGFWPEKPPMTKLIFEIIVACPSYPELISKIEIDRNSAVVYRGDAVIESGFDISQCALARGRNLVNP